MVRQLLRNGQVTLPKEAVKHFHLKTKDLLEVTVDRLGIHLRPLALEEFSGQEYARLAKRLDKLKRRGQRKGYGTTDTVRRHLDRLMLG